MSIYTRSGDRGKTSLFGGVRISKSDIQVETYGCIDELSAFVGFAVRAAGKVSEKDLLTRVQKDLYKIMSVLAGYRVSNIGISRIADIERLIDKIDKNNPKLTRFILVQGSEYSCRLHLVRTICRRAERSVVRLKERGNKKERNNYSIIVKYLNRLSDLLFVLARKNSLKKEKLI